MPSTFQFSPYDNSRASASLAELYLRQGEIAAEHVRQDAAIRARQVREAGQGRAQVIGSLGHLASGGIEEYQQYKAQAPQRQMQALQLQRAQQEIAVAQHEQQMQPVRDALIARQIAEEQLKSQEGRPEADLSPFGAIPTAPPNALAPGVTLPNIDAHEVGRPTPVNVPGIPATASTPAMPGFAMRPRSAEQLAAATAAAEAAKKRTDAVYTWAKPGESNAGLGLSVPDSPKTEAELAIDAANPKSPTHAQSTAALELLRQQKNPASLPEQLLTAITKGDTQTVQRITETMRTEAVARRDPAAVALANELSHLRADEARTRLEKMKKDAEPLDITPDIQTTRAGRQYVDLSSYTVADRQKAHTAANAAGAVTVNKDQANALQEIDNARLNQQSILQQIQDMLPKDPAGRVVSMPGTALATIFQTSAQKAAFNSWRTAAIQTLRATAGSKGLRINQAEIAQAIENDIPRLTDTLATAQQKVKNISTLLDNSETSILVRDRAATTGSSAPITGSVGPFKYREAK